jgi:purine-binding chemotaxis protein CheW
MNLRQLRDDPETRRILEERARSLARQEAAADAELSEELLTFRLGDGRYGASARLVREVRLLDGYTPLPGTPKLVLGLVNVRGRLLTALDIRPLLALPAPSPQAGALLLVVGNDGLEVGLLADEVLGVSRGAINLAPSLSSLEGQPIPWVLGVDRDLIVRIDLALLLVDLQRSVGAARSRDGQV